MQLIKNHLIFQLAVLSMTLFFLSCDKENEVSIEEPDTEEPEPLQISFKVNKNFCLYPCTINISDISSSEATKTYLWNFGDPASGADNSSTLPTPPQHVYKSPGTYTINLQTTDGAKRKGNYSYNIHVTGVSTFDSSYFTGYSVLELGNDITQSTDGNYVFTGSQEQNSTLSSYLVKVSQNGKKIVEKATQQLPVLNSILNHPAGGFMVVGNISNKVFIARLDDNFNVVFSKSFFSGFSSYNIGMIPTEDRGFIILANSVADTARSTYSYNLYLFKVDENGNKVWENNLSNFSTDPLKHSFILSESKDGGCLVTDAYFNSGTSEIFMQGYDKDGNLQWEKNHTYAFILSNMRAESVNDGYLFSLSKSDGSPYSNIFLIKTDLSGNKIWENTIGDIYDEVVMDIVATKEKYYVMVGNAKEPDASEVFPSVDKMFLTIIDPFGKQVFKRTFSPEGASFSRFNSVKLTQDGGILMLGFSAFNRSTGSISTRYDSDVNIIKTDNQGRIEY